jgi:hypothetical protein
VLTIEHGEKEVKRGWFLGHMGTHWASLVKKERLMAILAVFDLTTMTPEKYDAAIAGLEKAGAGHPDGRLYHISSVKESGSIVVTDVWESAAKLTAFGDHLFPVLHENGVTPVEPVVMPVRNVMVG